MLQLHPREQFTITRQLQDPYISGTFYVRAVIRNAKTDATLDTLDLDDKTNQRFTKAWSVPADVSGQGFWISIITSVYTDSGYTTKSENYGDEENTYLIQDRFNHNLGGGVGGGPDIDYKKIKKLIDESVDRVLNKKPSVVTVTKEIVKEVKIPEVKIVEKYKDIDFNPLLKEIQIVGKKVDDKPVTELPEEKEVNITPLVNTLGFLTEKSTSEIIEAIGKYLEKNTARFKKLEKVKKFLSEEFPEEEDDLVSVGKEPVKKVDSRISNIIKLSR